MGGDPTESRPALAILGGGKVERAWLTNTPVNADAQTEDAHKSRKVGTNEADDEEEL